MARQRSEPREHRLGSSDFIHCRRPGRRADGCPIMLRNEGADMFKKKVRENREPKERKVVAIADEGPTLPSGNPDVAEPAAPQSAMREETVSCIGSGMTIRGNIECNGPAQIFGRVEGEVRAPNLLIGDGAQVEGSIVAQDLTVCGSVTGTIRAVRVRLQGGGTVEGEIFHRSLSMDESAAFEGSSRRVENPTEMALPADVKPPQKKSVPITTLPRAAQFPSIEDEADPQRH